MVLVNLVDYGPGRVNDLTRCATGQSANKQNESLEGEKVGNVPQIALKRASGMGEDIVPDHLEAVL
jgi:hypothetical protein